MYVVTKEIKFETDYLTTVTFPVGTILDYKRLDNGSIMLWFDNSTPERSGYTGKDFDIEEYVEPINTKEHIIESLMEKAYKGSEEPYHIQIERCDCVASANRFLNTINGEDYVLTIPLENNQYLIIYKKRVDKS